jgi:hypothetical protein
LHVVHFGECPVDCGLALVEEEVELPDVDCDFAISKPANATDEAASRIVLVVADAILFDLIKKPLERFEAFVAIIAILRGPDLLPKLVIALLVVWSQQLEKSRNFGSGRLRHEVKTDAQKNGEILGKIKLVVRDWRLRVSECISSAYDSIRFD